MFLFKLNTLFRLTWRIHLKKVEIVPFCETEIEVTISVGNVCKIAIHI